MADVILTLTIRNANIAAMVQGLQKMRPIPVDPETKQPLYTIKQWAQELAASYLERLAEAGLRELAKEAAVVNVSVERT